MERHTDDLRNVREGDHVRFTTTEGETYRAECTEYDVQNADPRSGEVRETRIWTFEHDGSRVHVSLTDGLRSSEDDPEFPLFNEVWDPQCNETLGYIESLSIFGDMEAN